MKITDKEYKDAFKNYCKLHKYRFSGGKEGEKYQAAYAKMIDYSKRLDKKEF